MYKPNFCAECGMRIMRAKWRLWTARRFCDDCGPRMQKGQLALPLLAGAALLIAGLTFGRYLRPAAPPLIVQRSALSPLSDIPVEMASGALAAPLQNSGKAPGGSSVETNNQTGNQTAGPEEDIYTCGARTKKGTPCSRRVHGPVRCWQHKGMPAMLPQEKLLIKE